MFSINQDFLSSLYIGNFNSRKYNHPHIFLNIQFTSSSISNPVISIKFIQEHNINIFFTHLLLIALFRYSCI